jgi:hypothetical protein
VSRLYVESNLSSSVTFCVVLLLKVLERSHKYPQMDIIKDSPPLLYTK